MSFPLHDFIDDINSKLENTTDVRRDNNGVFVYTIKPGKEQRVEKLLEQVRTYINRPEVDINQKNNYGFTAAHYAFSLPLLELLLNDPRNTQPRFNTKEKRLHNLLYNPPTNTEEIKQLAQDDEVDLNKEDHHRMDLFDIALSMNDHPELLTILLNTRKVDINKKNRYGTTPIMFAVENIIDISELLNYPGININIPDDDGKTPLFRLATILRIFSPNDRRKKIMQKNFKLLVNHPDTNLDLVYKGNKIEDILSTEKYGTVTPEIQELLNYIASVRNRRMVAEVATMSGTDVSSNIQSRSLPQLPLGISGKISQFLNKPSTTRKQKKISEETKRYKERVKKEKEAAKQKIQADKAYRAREGILAARDSFPADADSDPSAFKGNNPRNLGGRKTRRKPMFTRGSTMIKNHNIY